MSQINCIHQFLVNLVNRNQSLGSNHSQKSHCKSLNLKFNDPWPSQIALVVKNPPANESRHKRHRFDLWAERSPWTKAWQSTPVFLPGESHGQRSLAGCSSQGHTESDRTEATQHTCTRTHSDYRPFNIPNGPVWKTAIP